MTQFRSSEVSGYSQANVVLKKYTLKSFHDPKQTQDYSESFCIGKLCHSLGEDRGESSTPDLIRTVSSSENTPLAPDLADLCRLHWLVLSRKAVQILEFGSGFSTLIIADALRILHADFHGWAKANLRTVEPFHVHSVDEEQRFLDISKRRFSRELLARASFCQSSVELVHVNSHIATLYANVPNVCPDLIYLDGPSQYATTQESRGFSIASVERMPMSADILTFEFFLQPGTLVVVDGRTANARFLKANLKRNWVYEHDYVGDIHLFELQEEPLGALNRRQLEFSLAGNWLLRNV